MGKEKRELVQHQQEQMKRNLEKLISGVRKYGNARKDNLYTTYMLGGSTPELQKQATEDAAAAWEKFKVLADQGGELITKLDTWKQNGYSAEEYKEIEETYNTFNQQVKRAAGIAYNLKVTRDYAKESLQSSFKGGKYSKYGKTVDGNSVAILNISDIQMDSATVELCQAMMNLNDIMSGMTQSLQEAEAEKKAEEELAEKKKQEELEAQKKAEEKVAAQEIAKKISDVKLVIKAKAGEGGKLFGAITSKDIAEELLKKENIEVDKKKIVLDGAIKQTGTNVLDIKLYPEVVGKLTVTIEEA